MSSPHAVLLDARGTLVWLHEFPVRLARLLVATGYENPPDAVARAARREIAHFVAGMDAARDPASLDRLRRECAQVLRAALPNPPPPAVALEVLLDAFELRVYPEVPDVLAELATQGFALGVVSNWDITLAERLDAAGIGHWFGVVVPSAGAGAAKPAAEIFHRACAALGVPPPRALHVGDDAVDDLEGARAAGCAALLVDRDPTASAGEDVITTLADLPARAAAWAAGA